MYINLNSRLNEGLTVLWENPNPDVAFESQTVTLSSDDYDYLVFVLKVDYINAYLAPTTLVPKGFSAKNSCALNLNNSFNCVYRAATYVSDTSYTFAVGEYCTYNSSTNNNSYMIPVAIYGGRF